MEFIEILKDIMQERSLTVTKLAAAIEVKPSQVSEWLGGKCKPSYDTLRKICAALEISGDYILGLTENN